MTDEDLRRLAASWEIALQAERLAPGTVKNHTTAVRQYLGWCAAHGRAPGLGSPESARAWLASLRAAGRQGGTMQVKLAGLRSFAAWLAAEGELAESGVHRVAWPRMDEKAPPALTAAQKDAIIAATRGRSFTEIRDEAIFSLLFDSMLRADELLCMTTDGDVHLRHRTVRVRRGKGGRERTAAFSAQTARRLDRYERIRRGHPSAALPAYWLAQGRREMSYGALYFALRRRGERAGVRVHPHMLRAGGAISWRRKGGSTESLMTLAGWRDLKMVMRYTRSAETELALEEAHRMFDDA